MVDLVLEYIPKIIENPYNGEIDIIHEYRFYIFTDIDKHEGWVTSCLVTDRAIDDCKFDILTLELDRMIDKGLDTYG